MRYERAQAAEARALQSEGQDALDNALEALDQYIAAAEEVSDKAERVRISRKCRNLFEYAELLKAKLSVKLSPQDVIVRDASRLHGILFPPWTSTPSGSEFELQPDQDLFVDEIDFTLSDTQLETFAGWRRPDEIIKTSSSLPNPEAGLGHFDSKEGGAVVFTAPIEAYDLVQDVTTDCSVVAGLSAAINVLVGQRLALSSIFYPFDTLSGRPKRSVSGKYVMKLNFNGCFRRVVIDDRLPASLTDRAMFVVDRANSRLLWPALLEKAYLKIRGGYDFPGSNSGTDLWVIMGWIPEQIFMQREELDISHLWTRIKKAHDSQQVVITIGTGCISSEEELATGLVGEHDYAVQGVREVRGVRQLLVKNPWCNSPIWTGTWLSPHKDGEPSSVVPITRPPTDHEGREENTPGAFWVTLEDVAQNFESMYLNWDPGLFTHQQQHHFTWNIPPVHWGATLADNPQFSLQVRSGGPVWVLVSRHFQDAELGILKKRTSTMAAAARQLGFMSLLVFDAKGYRVHITGEETYRGPYVDSPQTLARLDTTAGKRYTIVLDQHEFPLMRYSFTLSTFSHHSVRLTEASKSMPFSQERSGAWTRRTAGGNPACVTYFSNPQFRLSTNITTSVTILLATENRDVPIHCDLVWGQGKRVNNVSQKDLLTSSGEYRRGCAVATSEAVEPGDYTIVCSTFEAGQLASFGIRVLSTTPVTIYPIPAEAAGHFRTPLPPLPLPLEPEGMRIPIKADWLTRSHVITIPEHTAAGTSASLLIRISIVRGNPPNEVRLVQSGDGEFQNPSIGLRTPEFDIEPERVASDGLWIMVEGLGQQEGMRPITLEVLSESPMNAGAWTSLS